MNHIIAKEVFIPLQTKLEIINDLWPAVENGNLEAAQKLFLIYKQYISDSPKDDHWNCEGCRVRGHRHMTQVVNYWKQQLKIK